MPIILAQKVLHDNRLLTNATLCMMSPTVIFQNDCEVRYTAQYPLTIIVSIGSTSANIALPQVVA
jgi:hypothetical protein